jgi:hypothetical protein
MSLVVLIALPFNAPFAMDVTARGRATAIIDTIAAATPDDVPVWSDRSGRHHPAMQLAAFNSGNASLDAFPHTPLPPPAVTSVLHNTSVIAAVLRV